MTPEQREIQSKRQELLSQKEIAAQADKIQTESEKVTREYLETKRKEQYKHKEDIRKFLGMNFKKFNDVFKDILAEAEERLRTTSETLTITRQNQASKIYCLCYHPIIEQIYRERFPYLNEVRKNEIVSDIDDGFYEQDLISMLREEHGIVISPQTARNEMAAYREAHKDEIAQHPEWTYSVKGSGRIETKYRPPLSDAMIAAVVEERIIPEGYIEDEAAVDEFITYFLQHGLVLVIDKDAIRKNYFDEAEQLQSHNTEWVIQKTVQRKTRYPRRNFYHEDLRKQVIENLKLFATTPFESANSIAKETGIAIDTIKRWAVQLAEDEQRIQNRYMPGMRKVFIVHPSLAAKLRERSQKNKYNT
ncbi:MAG: hypothetical protein V1898_00880 [Patescibacteria group bacterium]